MHRTGVVRTRRVGRGFSLIECVVVILALAIAVPPTLSWVDGAVGRRADAVNTTRASALAGSVIETVLADVSSDAPGLGFAALAAPQQYVDAAGSGLRARLASLNSAYERFGHAWTLDVGGLIGPEGVSTGDAARDVYRMVTVRVTFPSASGGPLVLNMSAIVTDL